jgi:long-chain acyl-CoA synthetase
MESSTAAAPAERFTGSRTIADMMSAAAERYRDRAMVRYKADGEWHDLSYREVGEIVSEIGRGLLYLGIKPGDRVALLCRTRPEWTFADFAITSTGAIVVPIYPTNSPEECAWVAGNSEARAIVCEDAEQVAKILAVRDQLPALETIVVIDEIAAGAPGSDEAIGLDEIRRHGRDRDPAELRERAEAVEPDQPFTFIYTSGTTGPPKGCVITHGNYRNVLNMCEAADQTHDDDVVYLFLPLAHSYALLIQLLVVDSGTTLAYVGTRDPKGIIGELMEVHPTNLPSVPRIFEKLYTLAWGAIEAQGPEKVAQVRQAVALGLKVRQLQAAGQPVPEELKAPFEQADSELFANVRNLFGGRVRQANTGAAPIAQEILEFFYASGVPVLEGYGMTETATVSTVSTVEHHKFGTVGRALPGCEVRIADDGEVLIRGPHIFQGYYRNDDASFGAVVDGWLHTGDLGSLDEDGYLSITGRKKDIIITAGGKNLTPANLENDLKQSRWISQAVMYGDRRPYPVALITLDPEEIVPWAKEQGLPEDPEALADEPKVRELIQGVLDGVNERYARVEQIKRFAILDHDLSQETGELTPTLKVKRNVINEKYEELFDRLYAEG